MPDLILFFDTETTGKVDFKRPSTDDCQPRLVQLGAILAEEDGTERAVLSMIVDDGQAIPAEVAAIHGIDTETATRCGLTKNAAAGMFRSLLVRCTTVVAHNLDFDAAVMERHFHSMSLPFDWGTRRRFCTMRAATPICKVPHAQPRRPNDWKWPTLAEATRHFFGEELAGAHDALADTRAAKRIYFRLREMGL